MLGAHGIGFQGAAIEAKSSKIEDAAINAAKRKFTPEFMNRIDETVVFKVLDAESLRQILQIELGIVQQRLLFSLGKASFAFRPSDRFKQFLLDNGTDPKYGGRHLKRAIERHVVTPLSNLIATGQVAFGDVVRIEMLDGQPKFVLEPRGLERVL